MPDNPLKVNQTNWNDDEEAAVFAPRLFYVKSIPKMILNYLTRHQLPPIIQLYYKKMVADVLFLLIIAGGVQVDRSKSIIDEILDYLEQAGKSISEFSRDTKINRGVLSAAINGNPPKVLSVKMLDAITQGMGKSEGYFYVNYIEDCFRNEKTHGRRTKPLLIRSAELGRLDIIKEVVNRLAEDQKQIPFIFDCAEEMYKLNYVDAVPILYNCVVQTEKYNQSSRLAMSYYRLFQIFRLDSKKGMKAAMQFMAYRSSIPEDVMLEGLLQLANFFILRDELDEVERLADELFELSHAMYTLKAWEKASFKPVRPLVYYYGHSYLLKDYYYELTGQYEEAKKWVAKYADLSWMEGLDAAGMEEVKRFSVFAKANRLSIAVKLGDQEAIPEYIEIMRENEQEIVQGLTTLLESANKHGYDISKILDVFHNYLEVRSDHLDIIGQYKKEFQILNYANLNLQYAIYCFRKKEFKLGITKLLESIEDSMQIGNEEGIHKKMSMFEMYRSQASGQQSEKFNLLCRGMWNNEEKNYGLDFSNLAG